MADTIWPASPGRHGSRYFAGAVLCALANNVALIAADAAGLPKLVGVLITWLLGGSIGYFWHQRITFRAAASWRGYLQMLSGTFLAIPLVWVLLLLLQDGLHWSMWLAAPAVTLIMLGYNYLNARLAILRRGQSLKDFRIMDAAHRPRLQYRTLEKIAVEAPVDRLDAIAAACASQRVLDIGCLDETALQKRDTAHWLHGRIGLVASRVIGIDNSDLLPDDGLATGSTSRIYKGNGIDPEVPAGEDPAIDVIVAGEFIEHLPSPLEFLGNVKRRYPGKRLILSTPNGASFANALLGTFGREAQHHDHLMTSTYKTLNTLCQRAGFADWRIVPYRFFATEMLLQSGPATGLLIRCTQTVVRLVERCCPLRCFGYLVFITV